MIDKIQMGKISEIYDKFGNSYKVYPAGVTRSGVLLNDKFYSFKEFNEKFSETPVAKINDVQTDNGENLEDDKSGNKSNADAVSDTTSPRAQAEEKARKEATDKYYQEQERKNEEEKKDAVTNTDSDRAKTEEKAVDAVRKGYNPETQYLRYDPITKTFSAVEYDSDETKGFAQRLRNLASDVQVVRTTINNKSLEIQLNPETLANLKCGDARDLFADVIKHIIDIYNGVENLVTNANDLIGRYENADNKFNAEQLPDAEPEKEKPEDTGDPGSSGGNDGDGSSGKHHSHDSDDDHHDAGAESIPAPVGMEEQTPQIENTELIAASIGSLVFTTAISLYETIGGTAIQSTANAQYGLLGVEKINDVFYYKMIDKTTGKIYYAMASDVKVGEDLYEVETLHTKEESMLLNSTDIGAEDNFEKLADVDKYYIVIEKQEVNGIEFATVLDPTDGKKYYVPISASTEYENINGPVTVDEPASDDSAEGGE